MYAKLNHFDLTDCATREDLVQLFEEAFHQWKKNSLEPVDRRGVFRAELPKLRMSYRDG